MELGLSGAEILLLVAGGVAGGVTGSIAGLASLFTYPALLAVGLSPITANVTNTVALVGSAVGSISGSQLELVGQRRRAVLMAVATGLGGAGGAVLLLTTPAEAFEAIVPWLIALGSLLLLVRDRIRTAMVKRSRRGPGDGSSPMVWVGAAVVGVYGGYFGAGAGIMMLAMVSLVASETLAISNAIKNVAMGGANVVAAAIFLFVADVDVVAAVALGGGIVVGSWIGPWLVRRLPGGPLRIAIAVAGLGLAVHLAT